MTVEQLISRFVDHLSAQVSSGQITASTGEWYVHQLGHIGHLGQLDAAEFSPDHLRGVKVTYHLGRVLRRLSRWGVEAGHFQEDRFSKLRVPKCGQRTRIVTLAEFRAITAVAHPSFKHILHFMRETGCRPGEARGLQWHEVDLARRVCTLTNFKSKNQRGDNLAVRVIPLTSRAVVLLRWMQRRRRGANVFENADGGPWSITSLRCAMMRARRRAGLTSAGGRIVCYSMRHSRATELVRRGVEISTVSRVLGHSTLEMSRRYVHLDSSDLVRAITE